MKRIHSVGRPMAALLVALAMSVGVADAQTKINSGWNLFSAEQDVQIGQQSAGEAERQIPILNDSDTQAYINRIGQRLAANAGGPKFPYQFRVVNAADINAFALPGGPVYINRGIIDNAKNEGEIAGVVAHEIAHVALRHGTHQASKAYAAQAGLSILGGILGGKVGSNTAQILNTVGGVGLNVLFLKFSRELETQADVRGAQILAASGYTPQDMVSFFQTLSKIDSSKKTTFLSDHPAPPDRIGRIQKEAQLLRVPDTPTTNVAELNRVKANLRSRYGTAQTMEQIARSGPQQTGPMTSSTNTGTRDVSVAAPSSSMRSYTSPSQVYRVSYPSNWRVYQEGSTAVTMAPEGGIGDVNGKTEVVYGAIVSHYDPFGSASASGSRFRGSNSNVYSGNISLEDATNDLLGQVRQNSPHLRVISGSTQRFNLDGGPALSASLRGTNPNTGINERVTAVTRQLGDGHLLYLLFVTPEKDARNYAPVMQAMVNSMQIDEAHAH
jgi:Zn-dependent protease with chaperone function